MVVYFDITTLSVSLRLLSMALIRVSIVQHAQPSQCNGLSIVGSVLAVKMLADPFRTTFGVFVKV